MLGILKHWSHCTSLMFWRVLRQRNLESFPFTYLAFSIRCLSTSLDFDFLHVSNYWLWLLRFCITKGGIYSPSSSSPLKILRGSKLLLWCSAFLATVKGRNIKGGEVFHSTKIPISQLIWVTGFCCLWWSNYKDTMQDVWLTTRNKNILRSVFASLFHFVCK